ncbi:MAG: DUF1905 domain-containing protein [Acidobacteriota bacterium]
MKKKTFKAELQSGHQEDAVEVPFDPTETWSVMPVRLWRGRKGHRVMATLNGVSFSGFVISRQRKWFLLVDEDIKQEAGVVARDIVTVTLSPAGNVAG